MSKIATIAGAVLGGVVAFVIALVVVVNMRGGVSGSHAGLADLPLVGGLVKAQPKAEEGEDAAPTEPEGEQLAGGRELPFMRFAPEARLARLAQELDMKKNEYDLKLGHLKRKERELEAWQQQIELERNNLREKFTQAQQDLDTARAEVAAKEAELSGLRVAIGSAEQSNLKKTAEMCGRMSPDKGARILTQMYEGGEKDTVVKIIYLMEGRSAAKMLEAFTDPAVSAEIVEQLKRVAKSPHQGGML